MFEDNNPWNEDFENFLETFFELISFIIILIVVICLL